MADLRIVQSAETALGACSQCYRHGQVTPGTIPTVYGPHCAECHEKHRDSLDAAARELREKRVAYYRTLSEIGSRFEERTFANYRVFEGNYEAFEAAKTAREEGSGLYLYGPPGNGKTHLAGAIVNAAIAAETEAVFISGVGLLQRIRETYRRQDGESERSILEHYAGVQTLVLDDLGTENFTPATGRLFYSLINSRYEMRGRKLIVTSNLSPADLGLQWSNSGVEQHVAHKILDRIRELCDNNFVSLSAPSQRGKHRKEDAE